MLVIYEKYNVLKILLFIILLIIFVKIIIFRIYFIKKKLKELSNKKINFNQFIKKKKNTSPIRLAIALPIDSDIYKKQIIYNTLRSISRLNYNYSLFLIYNKKCPKKYIKKNCVFIKEIFNSIFTAFNLILDSIKDYDYIIFLTPGDLLKPSTYDFLNYIEEHDIFQIYEFKKNSFSEKKMFKEQNITLNMRIYDFINMMPDNINVIYDKIYKINMLKENNINFIVHEKSLYYFNLLCFSYSKDLLYINSYGIIHNVQIQSKQFYNNKFQEAKLFNRIISRNKSKIKYIIEDMNKIDYVFPYVTSDDPYWKQLYKKFISGKESKFESGIQRFRDNGMLKYLFRSIEKNLPWINKIHMIVMSESQVPNWVNKENVHIIYHSDFIPKKYLPAFSSCLIEAFLPNIPLVEEKFIYSNDDLIPCRYLPKTFFFYGNIPCYNLNIRDYIETAPGDSIRRNTYNVISGKKQYQRVVTTQHSTISYRMSSIKNCFKKYKNIIKNTLSKFRQNKNINQYIYSFYQMKEDTIINKQHKIGLYFVKPKKIKKIIDDNFKKYDFICLNDEYEMNEELWEKILVKLKKIYPKKSKYEKKIKYMKKIFLKLFFIVILN